MQIREFAVGRRCTLYRLESLLSLSQVRFTVVDSEPYIGISLYVWKKLSPRRRLIAINTQPSKRCEGFHKNTDPLPRYTATQSNRPS